MIKLLISVTTVEEALLALDAGVDILDLKNPAEGALGALPLHTVGDIVDAVRGRKTISATIGDLPMQPQLLVDAVVAMAASGVNIVKVGFFPGADYHACIQAMLPVTAKGIKLVAVLPADLNPDLQLCAEFKQAGFLGVMLDTFHKNGRHLLDHYSLQQVTDFIRQINGLQLECGVAGSLRLNHVQPLAQLRPGYMGFRGAVCHGSQRSAAIDRDKLVALTQLLQKYNETLNNLGNLQDSNDLRCNARALSV